jgi:hypothetical protein
MPDSERRIRTLSLRLSEVEYEGLKTQYQIHGARNVSDLARLALQRLMAESPSSQSAIAAKLLELDDRIHSIEAQLREFRTVKRTGAS